MFSAGIPRGLIEAMLAAGHGGAFMRSAFSAGIPRGLIEAGSLTRSDWRTPRFPRVFPAASLKRRPEGALSDAMGGFPRVFPAASLKRRPAPARRPRARRFPRVFPAASLKPCRDGLILKERDREFSAGIPRGLIEASTRPAAGCRPGGFSAGIPRGLIEAVAGCH